MISLCPTFHGGLLMMVSRSLKPIRFILWPPSPATRSLCLAIVLFLVWDYCSPLSLVAPCQAATITVSAPGPGGTAGADQNGTAADDTITLETGATANRVRGYDGDDTIVLETGAAAALVNGNIGNDTITNNGTVTGNLRGGGDNDTITNSGTVGGMIEGQTGSDTITVDSTGRVTGSIIGGTSNSSANTITNLGTVGNIYGTYNTSIGSSGGSNTISNSGSALGLYGTFNQGNNSGGGSNTITNSGTLSGVAPGIFGSDNYGTGSSGGSNTITNTGTSDGHILGSYNSGSSASGGGNTIRNTGTINSYISGSHNSGSGSSGGGNTIFNSGSAINLYGSYNSGANSSGGGNTITNTGTVTENIIGTENFGLWSSATGNTIINSGTVGGNIYGTRNTPSSATADGNTIINSGTVEGGIFGGTGDDTVIIRAGSSVAGNVDGQDGTDTLTFESAGTVNGSQYLNFESLSVTGATTITNTLTISGPSANTGTLTINSTLGTTALSNSGVLGGNGTISGNLDTSGTIAPGNSIGTLVITGNYTHLATGTYACELAGDGTSDLIQVTGTATLLGGTVSLSSTTALANGASWTILTAAGGVTGSFTTLTAAGSGLLLNFGLIYGSNDVQVTVSRTSYASLGATENQVRVGAALDSLIPAASTRTDTMAALISTMDLTYSLPQIQAMLTAMSPEMYDGFTWSAIEGARRFSGTMGQQMDDRRISRHLGLGGNPSQNGWNQWFRLLGGWGTRHGDSGHLGYGSSFNGLAAGADRPLLPWLTMGLAFGIQNADLDWDSIRHDGDQQMISTGVYARSDFGSLYLDASAACTFMDNDAERDISSAGYRAAGSFNGETLAGRLNGGYDFGMGNWMAGPQFSVDYLTLSENPVAETGADSLNLAVEKRRTHDGTSFIGIGGAARFGTGQRVLVPRIRLGWRHSLTPGARSITASFQDYPGSAFTVAGMTPATDALSLDAGLALTLGKGRQTFFRCRVNRGDGESSVVLGAGVDLAF